MKALLVEKINEGLFKGVLLAKSEECSSLSSPKVTVDGEEITMTEGSVVMEVDSTTTHILYENTWYTRE